MGCIQSTADVSLEPKSPAIPSHAASLLDSSDNNQSTENPTKLLVCTANATEEQRVAMAMFHDYQNQGLYQLKSELHMLTDLQMDTVLGTGGFACVLRGYWRNATGVAVKLFSTPPDANCPTGQPTNMPVKALAEALLAKDLAHPNIIKTYDVRCCRLSPAFLEALYSMQPGRPALQARRSSVLYSESIATSKEEDCHAEQVSNMVQAFTKYEGKTPLWNVAQKQDGDGATGVDTMSATLDGFGAPGGLGDDMCLSWVELLAHIGAKPNDYMTVIVMQHANYGQLWTAIKNKVFTRRDGAPPSDKRRRLRALLRTAREIVMGMEHLHACNVVHGDLKPANVLLHDSRADSRGFTAMLTDFGLAQFVSGAKHYCKNAGGTTAYMAPELFMDGELSRSSDVYAYGILLYEMVHGKAAYDKQHQQQVLVSVMHGFRPQWQAPDEGQLPELRALYLRCVDEDPDARPTATDLVAQLGRLEEAARLESRLESQETPRASR
ncbi:kinase-like domain-containing protein [Haematococcus lacustris]